MKSSLGGLGSQCSRAPLSNLLAVLAPLSGVGSPGIAGVFGRLFGGLQTLENLGQINTFRLGIVGPSSADSVAPGSPIGTGGVRVGERREGRATGLDGLASDLGVVVLLPLGSVFSPGLGCKWQLGQNLQNEATRSEGHTKAVVAGNKRKVGGNGGGLVLLGEPFTPGLPGLVFAPGVFAEEGRRFRRHF